MARKAARCHMESMEKISRILLGLARKHRIRAEAGCGSAEDWQRDPLSHPDIAAMSERERADLQFCAGEVCPE